MILDNDLDVRKNIQKQANTMKRLRRNIKAYVGWVRQNQTTSYWSSYRFGKMLQTIYFDYVGTPESFNYIASFSVELNEQIKTQIEQDLKESRSTLGCLKTIKQHNNLYADIIFNLVKEYIDEHNIDINNYLIRYKNYFC